MRTTLKIVVLAGSFFTSPNLLLAQWSSDPNTNNPICLSASDQFLPNCVSDNAGGAIITWEDYRNGANTDVFAQRISSNGQVLWAINGVPISIASNIQSMPEIAGDDSGGAIITWNDFRSGNYPDIYAQRINSSGLVQWTTNGVAICNAANTQQNPAVMSDNQGGAIIVWQDSRDGVFDIYAQRINSRGMLLWMANGIAICNAAGKQENPTIAGDGQGGAIITWQDYRSGTSYDVYAQRVSSDGVVQWASNGISLCNLTGYQVYPAIMRSSSGAVIITWFDVRNGTDPDIYAQCINASGEVQWTVNGVAVCTAVGFQQFPNIVSDGAGGAIITWQDYRSGTSYDVYAQRIRSDGLVQWTTNGVSISAMPNAQMLPVVTSDDDGEAVITWVDYRNEPYQDIYAQRINSGGTVQWAENGVAISTALNDQYTPSITTDGAGGAIIVWWDYRNGATSDIYAQQVNHNGQLGVVTGVKENTSDPRESYSLEQNYPNPFNPSTSISFILPNQAFTTLTIYNMLGQEIATLVSDNLNRGTHSKQWNATSVASGVYYYKLQAGAFVQTKKLILVR